MLKGASFLFPIERYARCSFRAFPDPAYRSHGVGFRCARDIGKEDG